MAESSLRSLAAKIETIKTNSKNYGSKVFAEAQQLRDFLKAQSKKEKSCVWNEVTHVAIGGSYQKGTAIVENSDLDIVFFIAPKEEFKQNRQKLFDWISFQIANFPMLYPT